MKNFRIIKMLTCISLLTLLTNCGNQNFSNNTSIKNPTTNVYPSTTTNKPETTVNSQETSKIYINNIRIDPSTLWINVGESFQMSYKKSPWNANEDVYLKSYTPDIIKAGEYGKAIALKPGDGTLYLETEKGLKSECKVKCVDINEIECPFTFNNKEYYFDNVDNAYKAITTSIFTVTSCEFIFETVKDEIRKAYVEYQISLTKTYERIDIEPKGAKIYYKLFDEENMVITSGNITSTKINAGESTKFTGSFRVEEISILKSGNYRIELFETPQDM